VTTTLDPASVLTAAELAAAQAVADQAPEFTDRQRDVLGDIFGPTLRALHTATTTA
jgi:hypothetical protein